jgi:two-component system OmpR family response regulator
MRILVVEDESSVREFMMTGLTRSGHQVEGESDGTAALKTYVERGPYDIVLTDIAHPGMDGIELVTAIREIRRSQAVIVCSGLLEKPISLRKLKDVPLLTKPWRLSQLLKLIDDTARRGCSGT